MTAQMRRQTQSAAPEGVARVLAAVRNDGRPVSLEEHTMHYGRLPSERDLIQLLDESRLRGRGGGSFPTGQKLRAVAAQRGRPVVVVNAAEAEPASKKDKALLHHVPHLVLDGAAAAAAAVGATSVVVAVGGRTRQEAKGVAQAIAERRDKVDWQLLAVPSGFVAGEETALLSALAGRGGKPTNKPPYPFESGLRGAPTLVQNVETLAHVALIARYGPVWFRSLGTEAEPGTALVTLSGAVARPGVYEVELGTRVSELVAQAGGATEPSGAFLVGGYFGGWVSPRDAATLHLTPETLGAGTIVAFPERVCPVADCARVARYLAGESAGQCGPCVFGLAAIADAMDEHTRGRDRLPQLQRWTTMVKGRGACRHPDGAARFVESALTVFAEHFAHHARHGQCRLRDEAVLPL